MERMNKSRLRTVFFVCAFALVSIFVVACGGAQGPAGPQGPPGPQGPAGTGGAGGAGGGLLLVEGDSIYFADLSNSGETEIRAFAAGFDPNERVTLTITGSNGNDITLGSSMANGAGTITFGEVSPLNLPSGITAMGDQGLAVTYRVTATGSSSNIVASSLLVVEDKLQN